MFLLFRKVLVSSENEKQIELLKSFLYHLCNRVKRGLGQVCCTLELHVLFEFFQITWFLSPQIVACFLDKTQTKF